MPTIMEKYRVHEAAKDLSLPSKELLELLNKYFPSDQRKHMTALTDEELNFLFDRVTSERMIPDVSAYFAEARARAAAKQQAAQPAPQQQPQQPQQPAAQQSAAEQKPVSNKIERRETRSVSAVALVAAISALVIFFSIGTSFFLLYQRRPAIAIPRIVNIVKPFGHTGTKQQKRRGFFGPSCLIVR